VRVPGYTSSSCSDKSLLFTWEKTDNSDDQMRLATDFYHDIAGYTHDLLSVQQTLNQNRTLDDLRRVAAYGKSKGLFNSIVAVSGGLPFSAAIDWLEALYGDGSLDIVPFSWQVDKWYDAVGTVQGIIDTGTWCHERNLLSAVHWGGGSYPGWAESFAIWDDATAEKWGIHDRFSFNSVLAPYLDLQYGQCYHNAQVDQVQSWLRKGYTSAPDSIHYVYAEGDAQPEYWWPDQWLEVYGDMKGYLAVCSSSSGRVSSLNGYRLPNGRIV
jgi:hypothetical protein